MSSPSCAAGATELIFKICGVAQETWVRGNVFVGCQQKPKKRKGHVTNTLHQRVGVKRSWVPSSNQTWLAGKATIYSWYKNPPLSGDDSEKLPISGSQMEKQFLRWRRLQILGSFPMFIHTYYNDTYIYMYIYVATQKTNGKVWNKLQLLQEWWKLFFPSFWGWPSSMINPQRDSKARSRRDRRRQRRHPPVHGFNGI